jgi:hypothetical protein
MTHWQLHQTAEIPVIRSPAGGPMDTLSEVDRRIAELVEPMPSPAGLGDRLTELARRLVSTRLGSALFTAWLFAAIVAVATLFSHATITVRTSLGPTRATCGVDVFVYGYPDRAIQHACQHVEMTRFAMLIPSVLVLVAGGVAAAVLAAQMYLRSADAVSDGGPRRTPFLVRLLRSRPHLLLAGIGMVGGFVGAFALNPVTVSMVQSGSLVTARCGEDTYFGGYPDRLIQSACDRAFSGQARVLEASVVLLLIGIAALLSLAWIAAEEGLRRLHLALWSSAAVALIVAAAAAMPVTVTVSGGSAPVVASCGLDTFVAGYPDLTVQSACRSHYRAHAATVLAAGALAIAFALGGVLVAVHPPKRSKRCIEPGSYQ